MTSGCVSHAAGVEGDPHGALCRLWAGGDACRARHHAGRSPPIIPMMLVGGFGRWPSCMCWPAARERGLDRRRRCPATAGSSSDRRASIPDKAARIVARQAASASPCFATATQIGAVTNLCAHQNGPLGEGRIIDGCITCPWHGYQYRLADGCAPPPFTEKLATYRVRLNGGNVEVDPRPLPPGTPAAISMPRGDAKPFTGARHGRRAGSTSAASLICPRRRSSASRR